MLLEKLFERVIQRYYPEPEENGRFIAQRLKELLEDVSQSTANDTSDAQGHAMEAGQILPHGG